FSSRRRHTRSLRDWSSDVCSSDLDRPSAVRRVSVGPATTVAFRAQQLLQRHRFIVASLPPKKVGGQQMDDLLRYRGPNELIMVEIGRASCRERGEIKEGRGQLVKK